MLSSNVITLLGKRGIVALLFFGLTLAYTSHVCHGLFALPRSHWQALFCDCGYSSSILLCGYIPQSKQIVLVACILNQSFT